MSLDLCALAERYEAELARAEENPPGKMPKPRFEDAQIVRTKKGETTRIPLRVVYSAQEKRLQFFNQMTKKLVMTVRAERKLEKGIPGMSYTMYDYTFSRPEGKFPCKRPHSNFEIEQTSIGCRELGCGYRVSCTELKNWHLQFQLYQ